jgi:hypothetical protein
VDINGLNGLCSDTKPGQMEVDSDEEELTRRSAIQTYSRYYLVRSLKDLTHRQHKLETEENEQSKSSS